jgi:hypothetical protein
MPQKKWTINSAGGGNNSSDLIGCHIVETSTGYDFEQPNNTVLASTTLTTLPFSFPSFSLDGWTWIVTVSSLSNPANGSWSNNNANVTGEIGTWSAGATADEDPGKSEGAAAGADKGY